jgi:hypothetical protein
MRREEKRREEKHSEHLRYRLPIGAGMYNWMRDGRARDSRKALES